jgi:hypothetical protein
MATPILRPDQEAEAQALAQRIRQEADDEILQLARLLVSKPDEQLFGNTEFEVRALVHRIGARAYEVHLREKKTATRAPVSPVPPAGKRPSSKTTEAKNR